MAVNLSEMVRIHLVHCSTGRLLVNNSVRSFCTSPKIFQIARKGRGKIDQSIQQMVMSVTLTSCQNNDERWFQHRKIRISIANINSVQQNSSSELDDPSPWNIKSSQRERSRSGIIRLTPSVGKLESA